MMTKPAADWAAFLAALGAVDIDALVALAPDSGHAPARAAVAHLDVAISKAAATLLAVGLKRDSLARSGRLARARALGSSEEDARNLYGKLCALRNDIGARLMSVGQPQADPHRPTA